MFGFLEAMLGGIAAGIGFAVGVGGTVAAGQRLRPFARDVVKSYLEAVDRGREAAAGLGETLEDLYAEAKAEREAEAKAEVAAAPKQRKSTRRSADVRE